MFTFAAYKGDQMAIVPAFNEEQVAQLQAQYQRDGYTVMEAKKAQPSVPDVWTILKHAKRIV